MDLDAALQADQKHRNAQRHLYRQRWALAEGVCFWSELLAFYTSFLFGVPGLWWVPLVPTVVCAGALVTMDRLTRAARWWD